MLLLGICRGCKKKICYSKEVEKDLTMNNKNDLLKYIDLYAGPYYYFHYKTANTAIIVLNCLIFGPMIPALYITGLVSVGM